MHETSIADFSPRYAVWNAALAFVPSGLLAVPRTGFDYVLKGTKHNFG